MAKKSARGRSTLAQVSKENNEPKKRDGNGNIVPCDLTNWEKRTYALMSDGKILVKHDCRFISDGRFYSYGWKIHGKLKAGLTPMDVRETWVNAYLSKGYVRENPR